MTQETTIKKARDCKDQISGLNSSCSPEAGSPGKPSPNLSCGFDISLKEAIVRKLEQEKASFHMPGHKGRSQPLFGSGAELLRHDITELPGLDDLTYPQEAIARIEETAAAIYGANKSFLSVNGASACLVAAIAACKTRGSHLVVPRNCHRSVVNALILTGLEPLWYAPDFDYGWNLYGSVSAASIKSVLEENKGRVAAVVLVSPTYGGALTDCREIKEMCGSHAIPLIVDEAHGAHMLPAGAGTSALLSGADIVVHSLHKTLSALTQTGLVHVGVQSLLSPHDVKSALSLVTSSSPSYLLMSSVESALQSLCGERGERNLDRAVLLSGAARARLSEIGGVDIYGATSGAELVDPLHLLFSVAGARAETVKSFLEERGIFVEARLGKGVLSLLGEGTSPDDIDLLVCAVREASSSLSGEEDSSPARCNLEFEQVLSPRRAFFAPSLVVASENAAGMIAAECIAPCPPGIPVVVPGQRISEQSLRLVEPRQLKVVAESEL